MYNPWIPVNRKIGLYEVNGPTLIESSKIKTSYVNVRTTEPVNCITTVDMYLSLVA